jgi:hypothetical protein
LRIKEQETCLTLQELDDDDDAPSLVGFGTVSIGKRRISTGDFFKYSVLSSGRITGFHFKK